VSELSPEAKALVNEARRQSTGPVPVSRNRMRRAVFTGIAASSAAAAAAAAAGTATLKMIAVGVVSAALGAGATVGVLTLRAPPPSPPVVILDANPRPEMKTKVIAPDEVAATPTPPQKPPEPVKAAPTVVAPPPPSDPTPEVQTPNIPPPPSAIEAQATLTAELRTLDVALAAADDGNWVNAREALDAYRRDFPRGALETEAKVLEVSVWCAEGRTDQATALTLDLQKREPKNPAVQRLLLPACAR